MKNFNFIFSTSLILLSLSGCATAPEADPSYVSPTHYQDYNCKQLKAELYRVSGKLEQASQANATGQVLGTALAAFAISQGYAIYDDGNGDVEYRRLSNQYDVLEQTAIQKDCNS